jgi:tRNA-splicing ligase RtcB
MSNLKKIAPATYLLSKEGKMKVPGLIIASEELLNVPDMEQPLEQVRNVAHLPGIVSYSIAMPDIHWGYGFPIGGVAAMDISTGVISPGGVGYDINCGVRMAIVKEKFADLKKEGLLEKIFQKVPSGVGHGRRDHALTDSEYEALTRQGAKWSISRNMGYSEDLDHIESCGIIEGADIDTISAHAKERGKRQLGSIGSGNHFIEIGKIEKVFLKDIADSWQVEEGETYILIHSGSRGFGHQICQDTLNLFIKKGFHKGLPDAQLVAAPINSDEGRNYFASMAAAANYAFNNRQMILHYVREAFFEVCGIDPKSIKLIYDVCHNIAKFEEHLIDGIMKTVCVHRKGATRAFGPNAKELNPIFQKSGQPVLVPGDMGTASYLMVGKGNPLTFCSSCHGAGRAKSRVRAMKDWRGKDLIAYMAEKGVKVLASSGETVAEEMPDAYKPIDLVVKASQEAALADIVAKLHPHLVIKG